MRKKEEPATDMTVSSRHSAATKRNMLMPSVCSKKSNNMNVKNLCGSRASLNVLSQQLPIHFLT